MAVWRFSDETDLAGLAELMPDYSFATGWFAGLLAVVAAFALFPALARVRAAPTVISRRAWLLAGATAMSIGLWGSQNIILLDLDLATHYYIAPGLSFASMLPAGLLVAAAIHCLVAPARPWCAPWMRLQGAAALLALAMVVLHLVLVGSMQGDLQVVTDPGALGQSLVLGYGFSLLGLYLSRAVARDGSSRWSHWLAGSLGLGSAILGSCFAAMAGTRFFDDPAVISTVASAAPSFLAPVIMGAVMLVVAVYWLGSVVDDRLAAAGEALRHSEVRHRSVVENMLDAHVISDAHGIIRSFNPAAAEMFGWSPAEVIGTSATRLFRTEAQRQESRWERQRGGGIRAPHRKRWIHAEGGLRRDGGRFPIEVTVSPFEDQGERFYSCTVRDLTERWAAETRTQRLAAAIEHAGDAIAILGTNHLVEYVNPQFERMTGFPRDEVLGRRPPRVEGDETIYDQIWATVSRGEVWAGQVRGRRRDASVFDQELIVTPVFDARGNVTSHVAVMRDITRRLEGELERRRLAEALQHCWDAIEILDVQGRIVYVNAAYESRSGQRLADIRGSRPEALLDYGPGEDSYEDMIQTVYRGGRPWSGVLKLRNIDGELCEEHVTVSPIRDPRGQVTGYVVVKRPVDERRQVSATQARLRALAGERA